MTRSFELETDPEQFASSAAAIIPEDIFTPLKAMIRELGIDAFLKDVAKLPESSPLLTQEGKKWSRKVAEILTKA